MLNHYNESEHYFVKKVINYKKDIQNNKYIITKFLNLREQEIIRSLIKEDLSVFGGYPEAEYKRVVISHFKHNHKIICFKIDYNKRYLNLTHRNILGSLLSLGIQRNNIGDILVDDDVYFFICEEIKDYIINEFKVINKVPITLTEVDYNKLGLTKNDKYDEKIYYLKSLRLDLVISKVYNVSRVTTKEMVLNELISINHKLITNPNHIVKIDDIISVRKKGRFKIHEILGKSKSDRFITKIGKII